MNNDLISREALKEAMRKAKSGHYATFSDVTLQGIYRVIDNAPTICGNNPKWCENCVSKGKCASTRPQATNNAELFKQTFGIYATELWTMPNAKFMEWLNMDVRGEDHEKS